MNASNPQKDVLEIDWTFFGELCRALALRIAGSYDPELVLGIAKAGVIPGAVVASILQRDFASMANGHEPDFGDRTPAQCCRAPRAHRGRNL
jgi:hypoxanthine phosphoribosyltransferase